MPNPTLNTSLITEQTNQAVAQIAILSKEILERLERLKTLRLKVDNGKIDLTSRIEANDSIAGTVSNADAQRILYWTGELDKPTKGENEENLISMMDLLRITG